ncbi:LamG domain-containing protein [Patescibacteria group bacterium]|nr:LamG domain-containing protein [Patescibacteria group bacterium]
MRTDAQRVNKYDKKVRGLVLPGQKGRFESKIGRQVEIERMVKTMGIGIVQLPYYIIFAKEIQRLQDTHQDQVLFDEVCILEKKWEDRGLVTATLNEIETAMNVPVCPIPVPPICQPYVLDVNTLALYHCEEAHNGTTVSDETGNYDGTASNAALIGSTPPRFGTYSIYPNALYNFINGTLLDVWPNNGSIEMWFCPDVNISTSHGHMYLFSKYNTAAPNYDELSIMFPVNANRLRARIQWAGSDIAIDSSARTWNAGQWYHVCVTWGSTGLKMYIDNVLEGSNAATGSPADGTAGPFAIGCYYDFTPTIAYFFDGRIDEIRVSDIQRVPDLCNAGASWPW